MTVYIIVNTMKQQFIIIIFKNKMMSKKMSLLNKQGSKQFAISNMKPFVKLTKKQYRLSSRLNYIYALEFKKKLYRQNIYNNLLHNSFKKNYQYFQDYNQPRNLKINPYYNHTYHNIVPFSSISKYNAFLTSSNLWAIQKQTTALKVVPLSSSFWLYSLNKLDSILASVFLKEITPNVSTSRIVGKAFTYSDFTKRVALKVNRKNKLWTAGFVRVRKLRQYHARQLQNTNKLLYWLGYPSLRSVKKIINKIHTHHNFHFMTWSLIRFLDSLWFNTLVKTNFVYNASASSSFIKRKKGRYNGFVIKNMNTFCQSGDLIYKT